MKMKKRLWLGALVAILSLQGWSLACEGNADGSRGQEVLLLTIDEFLETLKNGTWEEVENVSIWYPKTEIPKESNIENALIYHVVGISFNFDVEFIVIVGESRTDIIPFSDRPDFLGLNNGEIYTAEETYAAVYAYYKSVQRWPNSWTVPLGIGGVLLLVISFTTALNIASKRRKQFVGTEKEEGKTPDVRI